MDNWELEKIKLALKKLMKERRLSYQDLSNQLGVSLATVKRRLNQGELTVSELIRFATLFELSLSELVERAQKVAPAFHLFDPQQEALLAKDLSLLFLLRLRLMGHDFPSCLRQLQASFPDSWGGLRKIRQNLKAMEKVGLIEVWPNDQVVVKVPFPFKWREGGQLERAYFARILGSIFGQAKKQEGARDNDQVLCRPFELTLGAEHSLELKRDLKLVFEKYTSIAQSGMKKKAAQMKIVSGILYVDHFSPWDINP